MSVAVGLVHNGKVYIGVDSIAVNANDGGFSLIKEPKVFTRGQFIIGYVGSFRIGQLLRHQVKIGRASKDINKYLCTTFINRLREALKDESFMNEDGMLAGNVLIGVQGRLFTVYGDWAVVESLSGYDAIGVGTHYCLASLYTTADSEMTPEERVLMALKSTVIHNTNAREPFHVASK